jgi:spore germination cell wall hydrolase CwlJ-like protein
LEDSAVVISKNNVNRIIITLFCIICIQFGLITWLANKTPETITQQVEVVKEVEVIKEVPVEVEPTYIYTITSAEREMLARLVYREANVESVECQRAVVSVVLNRLGNGRWGNSVEDVIYAAGQFSPAYLISSTTPNNTNYEAVDYVLKNGSTLPSYVLYFRANYHFNWQGYKPYTSIDQTYFGYLEKDFK